MTSSTQVLDDVVGPGLRGLEQPAVGSPLATDGNRLGMVEAGRPA